MSTIKLVPLALLKRKKTISKKVDTGSLPSCQGNKKQKVDHLTMSISPVMILDHPTPMAKSRASTTLAHPGVNTSKPTNASPMTLLESKDLVWEKFNQAFTNEVVTICYDMSKKKFERSTIHDLFKVLQLVLSLIFCFVKSFIFFSLRLCSFDTGYVKVYGGVQTSL